MSELSVPIAYDEALQNLRQTGQQYPDEFQSVLPLGDDLTHISRKGVPKASAIDQMALQTSGQVYASDVEVYGAVANRHGVEPQGPYVASLVVSSAFQGDKPILGFSGYASGGFPYQQEADGIGAVFDHLQSRGSTPDLVVDGGTRLGVPGLSGLIASHYGAETLGVTPRQGLDDIAPRDHLIIHGKQYGDETSLIGAIPDVLVVLGGGPNGSKEYKAAIKNGVAVLMLALKEYPPTSLTNTYEELRETEEALRLGRLAVCTSIDEIPAGLDSLLADQAAMRASRVKRYGSVLKALFPITES